MSETTIVNYDEIEEAPLPEIAITFGNQKIIMVAPDDKRKIESVFQSEKKLQVRVVAANAETGGVKINAGDLIEFDLIRLCIKDNKPTYKNLAAFQRKQGGLYIKLKTTAWTLCGLDSVAQAMEEAEGE